MRLNTLFTGWCFNGIRFFIMLSFICTIAACGKKGSLYLPVEPEPKVPQQTQTVDDGDAKLDANETDSGLDSGLEIGIATGKKTKKETEKDSKKETGQQPSE